MVFLTSEPKSANCSRLAHVMGMSYDGGNRFLLREAYEPEDLFNEARFWVKPGRANTPSGPGRESDHPLLHGLQGRSSPVNYRVCDKAEHKSKNNYFLASNSHFDHLPSIYGGYIAPDAVIKTVCGMDAVVEPVGMY